jgi:tetraacyldisaccharide 4'-kinase
MEETARQLITRLAATPDSAVRDLPFLHRALTLPLLSAASAALRLSLLPSWLRPRRALPVPVVSVGNLTWGGNGKTPMVDFLARSFHRLGVSPLILTRVKLLLSSFSSSFSSKTRVHYIALSVCVYEQS